MQMQLLVISNATVHSVTPKQLDLIKTDFTGCLLIVGIRG